METVLNIQEQASAEEVKELLQTLTPEEGRAALAFVQGVRLGQTTAEPQPHKTA